jgi:cephalosporin hydroxylase
MAATPREHGSSRLCGGAAEWNMMQHVNRFRRFLGRRLPVGLRDRLWRIVGGRNPRFRYRLRRWLLAFSGWEFPQARRWSSDIPFAMQWSVKEGILQQTWRGVPMLKHPIESALYPQLLWAVKPRTIFEIGTSSGGSAIFLSDVLGAQGGNCQVITLDIRVPDPPIRPINVEFLYGDACDLGQVLTPEKLAGCERPWLVIEDASHVYEHTLAVLRFFDPLMRSGEYVVVEDGNVLDMGDDARFNGGPGRALSEFLAVKGADYEIDRGYCDRFGHNLTGNPNGYLRRR